MTVPSSYPVMIVVDPEDDVEYVTRAWQAHDPAAGVIAVHPTPGTSRVTHTCLDVLTALGKPIDQASTLPGQAGGDSRIAHAAIAWTAAEGIWHVIVLRAHLLTRPQRAWLIRLAAGADAVMTMVWHTAAATDWAAELPGNQGWTLVPSLPQALLAARLARKPWRGSMPARGVLHCADGGQIPSPHEEQDAAAVTLPPLPSSDFPFFRADAFRSLRITPDQAVAAMYGERAFDVVDAVYGYGMDMACTWILQQQQDASQAAGPAPTRASAATHLERLQRFLAGTGAPIAAARPRMPDTGSARQQPFPDRATDARALRLFLAALVADCPTRDHAIVRIRGAQAGFFLHGLLLAVPPLLDRATGRGLMALLEAEQADRIRSHVLHPVHAAALAAVLCTGADPADLAGTTADAVSDDGAFLYLAESAIQGFAGETVRYGVPAYARSLMRAALRFHRLCGHDASTPLLAEGIGRDQRQLITTARLCAMPVPALLTGRQGALPWDLRTRCWRIGEPLHRAGNTAAVWRAQEDDLS
jgi:hypothetical protein